MSIVSRPISFYHHEVINSFEVLLRFLDKSDPNKDNIEIAVNGPFRCMDDWYCSRTYAPTPGNGMSIPSDRGLSKREAYPVYEVYDKAFASVFPIFPKERTIASDYIQELLRKVLRTLTDRGPATPATLEELNLVVAFCTKVVELLREFDVPPKKK